MASPNYTSANIVPSADTFREWVDITNRIVFDMETFVISTTANTQGACTTGNAYVNGYFSANVMQVETHLGGVKANTTHFGSRAPTANLIISTNTNFISNSTHYAIINAQANAYFSGNAFVVSSNVNINSSSQSFTANSGLIDFNTANLDVQGGVFNISSNLVVNATATSVLLNSATFIFNGNGTGTGNVAFSASKVTATSGDVLITGNATSIVNVHSHATYFSGNVVSYGANVVLSNANTDLDATQFTLSGNDALIDSTTLHISGTTFDVNANVDVDNALTDLTAAQFNLSGNDALIDSTTLNISGTTFNVNANVVLNNANTDLTATQFTLSGNDALIDSTTVHISGTTLDVNANVDVDNADTNINATQLTLSGNDALIDSTTLHISGTTFDVNANVDLDNASTNLNVHSFILTGNATSSANINSTTLLVTGTSLNVASNTTITGGGFTVTSPAALLSGANVTIGDANSDVFTVLSNTIMTDKLNVQKAVDFDSTLNVDGNVSLNANSIIGSNTEDRVAVNALVSTGITPSTNGTLSLGTSLLRWDAVLDDATIEDLTVQNNALVSNNFTVTNKTTLDGLVEINDDFGIGNSTANTFTVQADTGNANTAGTLGVTGATSLANTLGVTGATSLANTLGVTGATSLANTLGVTGATSLANTLGVTGATSLANTLGVTGATSLANTLGVAGDATFNANVNIGNATTDYITFTSVVAGNSTNLIGLHPNSNDVSFGLANNRWAARVSTINSSSNADLAQVYSGGTVNTGTLYVRSTTIAVGDVDMQSNVIIGSNTSDNVAINALVSTGITPLANGTLSLGTSALRWDAVLDDATIQDLTVENNATVSNTFIVTNKINASAQAQTATSNSNYNSIVIGSDPVSSNTNSPDVLTVNADATFLGHTNVVTIITSGLATFNGNVDFGSNTSDTVSFTSLVDTNILPSATGKDLGSADNRWDLNAATINASLAATFSSTVGVTGATSLANTLGVAGLVSFNNTTDANTDANSTTSSVYTAGGIRVAKKAYITGAATLADTLGVTGATSLANTLGVTGATSLANTLGVTGATSLANTLGVTGATSLANTLGVTGATSLANTLSVAGLASFNGNVDLGNANTDSISFIGEVDTNIVPNADGSLSLGTSDDRWDAYIDDLVADDLTVTGSTSANTLGVAGAATLANTLGVTGATTLANTLTVTGLSTFNGNVDFGSNTSDTVSFTSLVDSDIIPSGNGTLSLGTSGARWDAYIDDLIAHDATVQVMLTTEDLTVSGNTVLGSNANNVIVANAPATFNANVIVSNTALQVTGAGLDANSDPWAFTGTLESNSTGSHVSTTQGTFTTLTVTGSASLPSNTSLSLAEANATNLIVYNSVDIKGQEDGDNWVKIGSANTITLDLSGARVNTHIIPSSNNDVDLGTSLLRWRHGYFGTTVNIGAANSTVGTTANTIAVVADYIYARNDLVAKYSSDKNLKDNIIVIDTALNKVESLGGYEFTWNDQIDDFREGVQDYGVIAQELEQVLPHAVATNSRGYKTVNYNSLIPLLIEAVKELSEKVRTLEGKQ